MASRDCSTELHTHRGQCWEPGQSERLCEVFTWCRSASDAAGEARCRKETGACLALYAPQGNGGAVSRFCGCCIMAYTQL